MVCKNDRICFHFQGQGKSAADASTGSSAAVAAAAASKVYVETYGCQMNVNDTEVRIPIRSANYSPPPGQLRLAQLHDMLQLSAHLQTLSAHLRALLLVVLHAVLISSAVLRCRS